MQKLKYRFFSFFLCLVLCFSIFIDNCFAAFGVDDAAIIAGAAGSSALAAPLGAAAVGYISHKLIEQYVADADADQSQVDLLAEGFRTYLAADDTYNFLTNPSEYLQYWAAYKTYDSVTGAVQNNLRLSLDSQMYKLLFTALGEYVALNADDGVITFNSDSPVINFSDNNYGSALNAVYNDFYHVNSGTGWVNWYFDQSNVVTAVVGYDIYNNPYFYVVLGDFPACASDSFTISTGSGVYTVDGYYISGCNNIHYNNMIYEPNTILAKFVYDPSAPAGAVPSGGVDVPVNSDFADTCADDARAFGDTYNTTYNVYNPSGVVTQTEGIVADIPIETAADGSIVYDDDGVPVVAVPSVGSVPWVLDDPEAIARVGAMSETVPDTLTGDETADKATVWGLITAFIRDFWAKLLQTIISGVRSVLLAVFIPSKADILDCFHSLKKQFESAFGVSFVDMSTLFGQGNAPENLYMDFDFLGLACFHLKVVDMDVVIYIVGIFRALIRGLLTLWLILYNINQFFHLIGAGDLALGSVREFQAAQAGVPAGRVRGDLIRAKYGGD